MNQDEFIKKWHHSPWVDRGVSVDGVDCWGLVGAYFKEVLGVDLTSPSDHFDIATGFDDQIKMGVWQEANTPDTGLFFTSFRGDRATHCGVVLNKQQVIHASGGLDLNGSVAIHSIRTIESVFGKVRYFKWQQ